jgi:hypothetical protein
MIERIERNGKLFAIIIRREFDKEGLTFVSPEDHPIQLGVHNRKGGTDLRPHWHKDFKKLENFPAQEVFFIVEGEVQVDLYDEDEKFESLVMKDGDIIFLAIGGHGVKFLKDTKMVEVKQGPYRDFEKEFI